MLLVGENGAVPSSLVAALGRRGLEVVIARQPAEVVLELAQTVRGEASRASPQPRPPSPASLVVVEPDQQVRVDELRAAVATYFPTTRCWRYDPRGMDGHAALTIFEDLPLDDDPDDFDGFEVDARQQPPAEAESPAYVRSAGHRLRSILVHADPSQRDGYDPLVSEEELAMLLGTDPPAAATDRPGER